MIDKKALTILSIVLALFAIVAASWFRIHLAKNAPVTERITPVVGAVGSTHRHMSIRVYTPEGMIDFSAPEFQIQDERVHFEEANGDFIHKHATGVTLPFLFETLGMKLTPECLEVGFGKKYCTDTNNQLYIFINRIQRNEDVPYYELQEGDQYLITYGNFTDIYLELQLNTVLGLTDKLESY